MIVWNAIRFLGAAAVVPGSAAAVFLVSSVCALADQPSRDEVRDGLLRAAEAFYDLSHKGGYPFLISGDLQTRYNEGHGPLRPYPDETYISIEPPSTPWIGRSFLRAYRATGDERFLAMAGETGDALATVQLANGGWRMRQRLTDEWADSVADDPAVYRREPVADFDDNRTQGPALFFVELIRDGSESEIHRRAMERALDLLLDAQYPSGGWPQIYPPPESERDYRRYLTVNDATIPDAMKTLLAAYRAFGDERHLDAVLRAADWLVEVRGEGNVWAQQYYDDFITGPRKPNHPAPARWFEPAAFTAAESVSVIEILIDVWLETGDERYVDFFGELRTWYEDARLEDGRWARFYELHTGRPLYVSPDRIVTYSDGNLRPGYAWKGNWGERALRLLDRVDALGRDEMLADREAAPSPERLSRMARAAREALDSLDHRDLWVVAHGPEPANIRADVFNRRIRQLTDYLEALSRVENRGE